MKCNRASREIKAPWSESVGRCDRSVLMDEHENASEKERDSSISCDETQ
jgi:hypothetical protein